MRRAGWGVWIAYDLAGSYEEMPPKLIDELARDRRWCQGNLMNFRLFWCEGLHPAHRAVFLTGVMAYVSAPLWFLFLMPVDRRCSPCTRCREPHYFTEPYQLFPLWPEWQPEWAIALFAAHGAAAVPAQGAGRAAASPCTRSRARTAAGCVSPSSLLRRDAAVRHCSRRSACCSTRSSS